jgi:hypothetical protein
MQLGGLAACHITCNSACIRQRPRLPQNVIREIARASRFTFRDNETRITEAPVGDTWPMLAVMVLRFGFAVWYA